MFLKIATLISIKTKFTRIFLMLKHYEWLSFSLAQRTFIANGNFLLPFGFNLLQWCNQNEFLFIFYCFYTALFSFISRYGFRKQEVNSTNLRCLQRLLSWYSRVICQLTFAESTLLPDDLSFVGSPTDDNLILTLFSCFRVVIGTVTWHDTRGTFRDDPNNSDEGV